MLGEKRNLSLFASQPAQEDKQVKHITVDRDGEKKDIPLYFGPDWPVVNGTGDTVPSPSDDPSSCQAEATAEKTEETVPVEPIPQDTAAGIADNSPDSDVQYPDDSPRRILASNTVVANRTHALFFAPEGDSRDFNSVLKEVQEYISGKYSSLITDGGDEDAKSQIKRYITKYVQDQRIAVKGYSADGLVDALYTEMAEFGLLTKYIFGTGIEEININSWRDIEVLYSNGQMVKLDEHFDSPGHAINVIRRMLHVSGMVLDNASPAVLGHLSKNIRIAVLKTPLVDEDVGVTASIRIVNPQNMQKDDFVRGGTATGDMLDFLSACLRYGVSVCVAGATGSGKTTVAGWLLTTIPDNKRVFTIENGSRELDLVREKDGKVCNSVIHTITRESENAKQNIDQDMLLDMALRYHPDIICVGEMRSAEAYAAQEAARTGHGVLTTIHSNSSQATWRRMVTLCKRKHEMSDDTLMDLVTEAFPVVAFAKQLEDKSRKIMEIMECVIQPDGSRQYNTLYHLRLRTTGWRTASIISMGTMSQSIRSPPIFKNTSSTTECLNRSWTGSWRDSIKNKEVNPCDDHTAYGLHWHGSWLFRASGHHPLGFYRGGIPADYQQAQEPPGRDQRVHAAQEKICFAPGDRGEPKYSSHDRARGKVSGNLRYVSSALSGGRIFRFSPRQLLPRSCPGRRHDVHPILVYQANCGLLQKGNLRRTGNSTFHHYHILSP